ncbi:muts domain V-domain-containing protein [Xylaria palmicola]|nr:muts domain V-domain-containing protein [Xylaria palmicola]
MAGPSKEKRQQSLTNFFTPKAVNNTRVQSQSREQASPNVHADSSRPGDVSLKRPIDADLENGTTMPKKKKKSRSALGEKRSTVAPESPTEGSQDHTSLGRPNNRTERYLYDGSSPRDGQAAVPGDEQQQDDVQETRRKEELHRKFVQKLGRPDSIPLLRRRNNQIDDENQAPNNEDGEDEDMDEAPQPSKAKKKGAKTGKLTPMEIQFLDIKRKHMDTLLIVEVGYKFKFFGEDARTAAKELSIVCIPGKFRYDEHPSEAHLDRFASASIPVHRLPVHAKRLVAAGHKVGVVRQIETAALKKVGDNRNAPFTRKLTNVYTKGTYIDEIGELDQHSDASSSAGGYLLCITETGAKGWGTDEKVDVGILAVQPATGDIIYDNFQDGFMRSDIETRLLHISPCEFLLVGELSKATEKLIQHLSGSSTNVFGDRSRVERVGKSKTITAEAYSHVTQFYSDKVKENEGNEQSSALLDKVLKLPEAVTICLSSMINHLKEYGLEHIFDLTKYFQSFSARQHMLVNGTTLESLEVYRNQTDHTEKGSLFWALDKTLTRFGQRLLRKWVGRPLLDKERLEERVAAVEELLDNASTAKVDQLEHLLKTTKTDLERSLIRIYYGKCTRPELLAVLQTLQSIASTFARVKDPSDSGFTSVAISNAIASLPLILPIVLSYLERINAAAARADDKYAFFRETEETEAITDHKLGIASVEQELDAHRNVAASKLNKKAPVSYVTVAGIEYLVEVSNADLKHVPASWIKISGTKKLSRFHTPEVVRLISERDQHKESLSAACDAAFSSLLQSIASDYQPLRDAISSLATLDCFLSLSKVAALPGYTKPEFLPSDTPPTISVTAGRHPIAEQTLATSYIPFSTTLASPAPLAHLITGPNMGGKSSFVRAVALLVLLAQIGSFVPADSLRLTLADAIHTRMGARDNLFRGESTFMVEVSETARILRSATPRSLVVLDELGRGTSTYDGAAIAQAVLQHVIEDTQCLTLFITHYQSLAQVAEGFSGKCKNVHMRFTAAKTRSNSNGDNSMIQSRGDSLEKESESEDLSSVDEEITFLYEVGDGVAHRSYGLNVARLARIPRRVLDVAAKKSQELEDEIKQRRLGGTARLLASVMGNSSDQLDHLISSIEQL